ncbi:recombination and repair protein RecT [compost metagenome]
MAPRQQQQAALGDKLQERSQAVTGQRQQPSVSGGIKSLLAGENVKKRFSEILDKRAPQFMASIINLVSSTRELQAVDQMTVISSCIVAATLDLPVDKNLGYAWIVPYAGKATFQMGYKGYIQLALRTGKYKYINVLEIYEGELKGWNRLTEKLEIDFEAKKSDAVIGYAGYFELVNGFIKTVYWTAEDIKAHKEKFSKSDFGWKRDYHAMAKKTVLRNMLSKWGILSIEMQNAYTEEVKQPDEPAGTDGDFIPVDGYAVEEDVADIPPSDDSEPPADLPFE